MFNEAWLTVISSFQSKQPNSWIRFKACFGQFSCSLMRILLP